MKEKLLKLNTKNTSNNSVRDSYQKMNITDDDRKNFKQMANDVVASLKKIK